MTVSDTPVAVIGAACRLPGANSLEAFWDVLIKGRCVITEVDQDRFGTEQLKASERNTPGRAVTFAAGQIDGIFEFDPGYFGISPREAAVMDPQQRVLLEVTMEALHNAGIPAASIAGEEVGVYVGASSLDYSYHSIGDPTTIEPQSMLGNTLSIIANRLSYVLDLRGPSYAVDTACSSSLIALHHAVQDIQSGRVDTAIVGGVSLLLNFVPFLGFSRAQMLSAKGLCRAFDAAADGYVRSEGALALVLKAEKSAREAGDPIRSRIIASGINADGRTPGLSLPSTTAQADLLRAVYERGAIDPNRLAFVEAHGTGTPVGDPIEAEAIGRILGQKRQDVLLMGSSKTNFGHLEPASGLVGVLKAQEALARDVLPASLHLEVPNPHIPFAELNLTVPDRATPLSEARNGELRLAGVNSFGFGGANAHVVVADGTARPVAPASSATKPAPLMISAATADALAVLADRYRNALEHDQPQTLANAAAYRRDRLAHRAVIAPAASADMKAALQAVSAGQAHPLAATGEAIIHAAAPVFVYSGNGSQWAGMGRAAYQGEADFRESFERTDRLFMSAAGWSLVTTMFSSELEAEIERTEVAQPLLFALQVALTEALARQGLKPAAVVGHSVGEVAAAWAAGALSLADAVRVIHARSTHQEMTRHLGGMAALLLPADEAEAAIAGHAGLEIAAVNSPRSVTVSGPSDMLTAFGRHARSKRWAMKRLPLDYPFHCALVEPIKQPLVDALATIVPRKTSIPFVSTVTGTHADGSDLGADYWWRNVRQPVRFADAVNVALQDHTLFLEVGPRAVLTGYVSDIVRAAETRASVLASFSQNDERTDPVADTVRRALVQGAAVDDPIVFGRRSAPPEVLPAYPWQHQYFRAERSIEEVRIMRPIDHAFLGQRMRVDDNEWRGTISTDRLPFLADHKVENAVVFPAAGFVEMVLAAGAALYPGKPLELSNLDIVAAMVLDGTSEREVRTALIAPHTLLISSRPRLSEDGWTPHVKATIGPAPGAPPQAERTFEPSPGQHKSVTAPELYALTAAFGLPYGPAFRRAEEVSMGPGEGVVRLAAPDPAMARHRFKLDPTLFDSCFHGLFALLTDVVSAASPTMALLPVRMDRLRLAANAGTPVEALMRVRRPGEDVAEADFTLFDANGAVVAHVDSVRFQAVPLAAERPPMLRAEPRLRRVSRMNDAASHRFAVPQSLVAEDLDPSDTALLVEAGVQAAAATALGSILAEPAPLAALTAGGLLAADMVPLAARLLLALEASGAAERMSEAWHIVPTALDVDSVVNLLIAEHPDRLAEAAVIAALADRLSFAFSEGADAAPPLSEALSALLLSDARFSRPLYDALIDVLAHAIERAAGESLAVCVVGATNISFLRRVLGLANPDRVEITITDRDDAAVERVSLLLPRTAAVHAAPFADVSKDAHGYDLVILTPSLGEADLNAVANLARSGGTVIGAAYAPSLFADAIGGFEAAWWARSADPEAPVGRLPDLAEWQDALGAAGLIDAAVTPLANGDTDSFLYSAYAAKADRANATIIRPDIIALGAQASRIADAISALPLEDELPDGESRPIVFALSAPSANDIAALLGDISQRLVALGSEPRRVTVVTFGAQGEAGRDIDPVGAAVAAFARVASNEMPHLDMRLVDIAPSFDASAAAVRLLQELEQPNDEREIVLFSDDRAAVRYVPSSTEKREQGDEVVLAIPRRGSIDNLEWQSRARQPLGAGEVRLRVEAVGLNFRDVMWALGLLPHEALQDGYAGPTLGMECSGIVEEIGDGVDRFSVGDAVIAFAPASFASHSTVRADAVVRRPEDLTAEAAATIPVAFLTAFYALDELARIREGETVLIHGGAGGVGLAALQIAKWRGATVFATAGSLEKRALLMRLGADRVFDSRALTFADEAREATGGEGVDVVLNSLAGEAMERSIGALKPFGRFLELGKRDFYADTKLGLRPFRQNLSYFGIDADQLMRYRPELAERLLTRLMELFDEGELTPLPYRAFDPGSIADAFRLMQSAGHIGKIVVNAPEPPVSQTVPGTEIDPDKTYLLIGGTSGFGFATAEWLIGEGARHLVLASRSGVKDPAIAEAIARHRAAGVSITEASLDVTDTAAVTALVDSIDDAHPLTGVFHMAMVLDDALIASLDADRFATVLRPKVLGVEALETATAGTDLSLFVVYSSITVQLGNPGQANYVAANAYLEGVARRRRAAGKPALAIAWGAIADVGVLARDSATSDLLQQKLGRHSITSAEGLAELGRLLASGAMRSGAAVRLVGQVDWAAARKDLALVKSPTFGDIADASDAASDEAGMIDLSERLAGLSEGEAVKEVCRMLSAEISRILKLPASEVDVTKPLTALGMDSLMGVELRMAAEQRLGIEVPLMSLASGATINDLAKKVVARTLGGESDSLEGAAAEVHARHVAGGGAVDENVKDLAAAMEARGENVRSLLP